jgi:hypothetical protein
MKSGECSLNVFQSGENFNASKMEHRLQYTTLYITGTDPVVFTV